MLLAVMRWNAFQSRLPWVSRTPLAAAVVPAVGRGPPREKRLPLINDPSPAALRVLHETPGDLLELIAGHQPPGLGMLDEFAELLTGQPEVKGHGRGAQLEHGP
jgi:hypothetical protein